MTLARCMLKVMKQYFMKFFLLVFFGFSFSAFGQHTLSVSLYNTPSSDGAVKVAVYDSEGTFLKFDNVYKSGSAKADKNKVVVQIEDVAEGKYAIAVFHDANDNNELDTNWLGIPREKVAFSKAKMKAFGPPKFKECAFTVNQDTQVDVYF